MDPVKIYTTSDCPFCHAAKDLLKNRGYAYEEIDVSEDEDFDALVKKTGWKTVPQIFFGDEMIGGFRELTALDREGKLKK